MGGFWKPSRRFVFVGDGLAETAWLRDAVVKTKRKMKLVTTTPKKTCPVFPWSRVEHLLRNENRGIMSPHIMGTI
jgi:hypothetical protein